MRKALVFASLAIVGLAASACTETASSSDIKTHGIRAGFDVTGGSTTKVEAELKVGEDSNTYVNLDNGDSIEATVGSETKTLQSTSQGRYSANFSTTAAESKVVINFKRPNDTSAPNSTVTLPAAFTLGALPTTPPKRATEDITVTWTPVGTGADSMRLTASGDCIFEWTEDMLDAPGTYTIKAGSLKPTDSQKAETCTVTLKAERYRNGSADPALNPDSYVHAHQYAQSAFQSAP